MQPKKICIYIFIILTFAITACREQGEKLTGKFGNENMGRMLDSIRKINFNKDNPFCPEAQLEYYNAQIINVNNDPSQKSIAGYFKATALLQIGKETEAEDVLRKLVNEPGIMQMKVSHLEILKSYALANLRLGERSNCITNRCAESCVFPIKGSGVHQDKIASIKAIAIYDSILKQDPNDLESKWLLNIAYMTLGQYPDKVPAGLLIPNLDKENSDIHVKPFIDVAQKLRLDTKSKAGGTITDDFDNDGYLDLITSDMGLDGDMHFFKSIASSNSFIDVTSRSGLNYLKGGLNMIQADYNNDGYTDIFVLRGAWQPGQFGKQPNSLLRNNGDCTFTDVTIESGLLSFNPTQAGVWRDFNNDGWLDLFIGNETTDRYDMHPSELYMSKGDGTFINVATQSGCDVIGFVKGVTAADYNNDGWQDIYISTCDGRRLLLKNESSKNGSVHFRDVTHEAGLDDINMRTFPTWFWDYDNDGWPDIFVCGYQPAQYSMAYSMAAEALGRPDPTASKMYLYHNNHDGTFSNVSREAGLDHSVFSMGANFGDIDNDGWADMYLGTGNPDYKSLLPNKLFKNIGGKKFADVTTCAHVGNLQKGHGVAFADMDNDGDQDIYVEVGGAYNGDAYYNSFYLNPWQNTNNWISLTLKGTVSNRSAIGARIKITFKENGISRSVYNDVNSGGSFGCSPLRKEIGIGSAQIIDEINIKWPSGKEQVFKNVKPCRFLKIKEDADYLADMQLQKLNYAGNQKDVIECEPISTTVKN